MVEENKTTPEDKALENKEETEVKKKINPIFVIAIIGGLVLLALMAAFIFVGGDNKKHPQEVQTVQMPPVFFEMPEVIVSLSGNTTNIRYLKLVLSLEVETEEAKIILQNNLPKITDEYQVYLRQLRLEDLRGSIGTYRLKDALLLRANQVVQPTKVKDVLIKEMLIQ